MPDPRLPKTKKAYDPKDVDPCSGCSNCCEYVALEIDKPSSIKQYDEIIWYLLHRDVWVYIDHDGGWYIQFNTPCDKLDGRRCGYYPYRPNVCRDYHPKDCVRYGDGPAEKHMFKNEVDLFRYLANKAPKTFARLKKKLEIPFSKAELTTAAV